MLRRATLRLGSIRSKLVGTVAKPAPELPLVAITNPNEKYVDFYPEDPSLPPTKHSLNNVIKDMEKSLHDYHDKTGFGRAVCAPMLGYHTRVIVAFLDHRYTTLINPRWSTLSVQKWSMWDNCCMFPDEVVRVARHVNGTMRYTTREGDTEEWLGLPFAISELLQHEFDHLDALTSLDRMSAVKLPEGHIFSRMPFVGKDGTLSRMPRVIFDKHRDECAKLVSPIYTADHIASAPSPHKISSHPD